MRATHLRNAAVLGLATGAFVALALEKEAYVSGALVAAGLAAAGIDWERLAPSRLEPGSESKSDDEEAAGGGFGLQLNSSNPESPRPGLPKSKSGLLGSNEEREEFDPKTGTPRMFYRLGDRLGNLSLSTTFPSTSSSSLIPDTPTARKRRRRRNARAGENDLERTHGRKRSHSTSDLI